MKTWLWGVVGLLLVSCVVGVTWGLLRAKRAPPPPSPVPSTTAQPFPSLTVTPRYGTLTLLHDTFQGPPHLPLTQHPPNAPIGIFWVPYTALPSVALQLTGDGTASNLQNTSTSPATLVYAGANITSGQFSSLGYQAARDVLRLQVTVTVPTIDPRPEGNEALLMFFALSRTVPRNDQLALGFEYRLGQATSDPPSWSFGASTNYDLNGVNAKTQTLVDTGFVSGDPPLNTPLHFSFTIYPNGHCVVECPELHVQAEGPSTPDIIPAEGAGMNSCSMYLAATQTTGTAAQPLYIQVHEVLVTAEFQVP